MFYKRFRPLFTTLLAALLLVSSLLALVAPARSQEVAGESRAAEDPTKNVELAGTLTSPWPTSEDFAVTKGAVFFQSIDPATENIIGVAVVDVSRADAPQHTATIPDVFLEKLFAGAGNLFGETSAGTGKYETHIYSLAGTAKPDFKGKAAVDGWTVYADSQYAIVRTRIGSLSTIDLTNPQDGVYPIVGGYAGPDKLLSLTTSGVLAYAGINNGLKILSFGTPTAPAELSTLLFDKPYGNVYDLSVSGGYAYVKAGSTLLVVDVSDPGSPVVKAAGPIPGFTGNVRAAGELLYTANSDGLHVYSLADPLAPVEVGYYREQAGGEWMQIEADGTTVYATVRFNTFPGTAELRVLRFTGVPAPEIAAAGPGVTVNGTPLTNGNAQAVNGGEQVEIAVDGGPAQMQLRCVDLVEFLLFLNSLEPGGYGPFGDDISPQRLRLILSIVAVNRACLSTAHSQTADAAAVSLDLTLQSGGLRLQGMDVGTQVTISTTEASGQMVGMGQFVAARPSGGVTTTVLSLAGPVLITPANGNLTPVTLNAGDWVRVTADAISPVQSIYTERIFLPVLNR